MTDTTKLKELAERATPGPWQADQLAVTADTRTQVCCGQAYMECCGDPEIEGEEFDPICSATSEPLADFIAAANPQAILGLISRLDGLLEQHGRDSAELRALCQARDDARKERDRLKAEVERLRARLEIDDRTPYDGIACRDETIKGLDEKCDRLKAENAALRKQLEQVHPFKFAGPLEGPDLKCAACGGYHYGLPAGMPCPKSAAVAIDAALEGGGR